MSSRRSNGEGSICQLPSGSWRAQVSLAGKRISYTSRDRSAARAWIGEIQDQIGRGLTYDQDRITLGEYLESWLKLKRMEIRPATVELYTWVSIKFIQPELGRIKLRDLSSGQVQLFYNRLAAAGKGPRTIRVANTVLGSCLDQAKRLGLVYRNPADLCSIPRLQDRELKIWTEDQVSQFLNFISGHIHENLYYLALGTGMRRGELLGLQWSDIDWIHYRIQVRRECFHPVGGGFIFQDPKTKQSRRSIQIGEGLIDHLRSQIRTVELFRKKAGRKWQDLDLVFPSSNGTPLQAEGISHEFKRLISLAGMPEIRFHDCRHIAASIMLSGGIPPVIVAGMLGHSVAVLLNTYSHLIPNSQGAAAQLMDNIITPIEIQALPLKR